MSSLILAGANALAQYYQPQYDEAEVFSNLEKFLIHTTETRNWPGYSGGASAPNATYHPGLRQIRQHFDNNRSARALRDPSGTLVRENRDDVFQLEIICYSDKSLGDSVGGLWVGDLTSTHMIDIAAIILQLSQDWGLPVQSTVTWREGRETSFNNVRLSGSEYDAYKGILGHVHASGNTHWDPGGFRYSLLEATLFGSTDPVRFPVVIDLGAALTPSPASVTLEGNSLVLEFDVELEPTVPEPTDPEPPDPDPELDIPQLPSRPEFTPGAQHPSFTLMGQRFKEWLQTSEIARAGAVYNPGPTYTDWDDFNIRKIQYLMDNEPDSIGQAFFGSLQWERLFTEDRPAKSVLPEELQGQTPPQREDEEEDHEELPPLPDSDDFNPGTRHDSFIDMGHQFSAWLNEDEISHDGDGYQAGAIYSDYDDFNIRKVQHFMDNAVDPAGKAYFGEKQWELFFSADRPSGASLPSELKGRVPPQLRSTDPDPPPASKVPSLPSSSAFQPGKRHSSFTDMGERFLKWLKPDEIHKAGSTYTPGPNYSVYDDRNVRAVQYLMGNTPDSVGQEFLGSKQWQFLFTQPRPNRSLPASLKPGGNGGTSGEVPCEGQDITVRYGVPGSWAAGYHTGVDFGDRGSDILRTTGAGRVVDVGTRGDWGKRVIVKHSNGRYSWYCHLRQIDVSKGQRINSRGVRVGLMGETGRTFGKHLHYQESTGGYGYRDQKRPVMLGFAGY